MQTIRAIGELASSPQGHSHAIKRVGKGKYLLLAQAKRQGGGASKATTAVALARTPTV